LFVLLFFFLVPGLETAIQMLVTTAPTEVTHYEMSSKQNMDDFLAVMQKKAENLPGFGAAS